MLKTIIHALTFWKWDYWNWIIVEDRVGDWPFRAPDGKIYFGYTIYKHKKTKQQITYYHSNYCG